MASRTYKRKKNANHKRNQRRRERLMAQGMTREEAQAIIDADGEAVRLRKLARDQREAELWREFGDADRRLYPRQPSKPRSVRAIPSGAFDSNRRRH